jgi:hypothetical protein
MASSMEKGCHVTASTHRPLRSAAATAATTTTIAVAATNVAATTGVRVSSVTCHARPRIGNVSVSNPGAAAAGIGAPSMEDVDALYNTLKLRATP